MRALGASPRDFRGREFGTARFGRRRSFGRVAHARDFPQIFWRSFPHGIFTAGPSFARRIENF